jgi:hypothetical protein
MLLFTANTAINRKSFSCGCSSQTRAWF